MNWRKNKCLMEDRLFHFILKTSSGQIKKKTFDFLNNLKIIDISNNLGDTKSLITHPYTTTHHRLSEKEKMSLRITQNLVRLSVGLEDVDDLIDDIRESISKTFN